MKPLQGFNWAKQISEHASAKIKSYLSAGKVLATIFYDIKRILLIHFLPERRTVNVVY